MEQPVHSLLLPVRLDAGSFQLFNDSLTGLLLRDAQLSNVLSHPCLDGTYNPVTSTVGLAEVLVALPPVLSVLVQILERWLSLVSVVVLIQNLLYRFWQWA